MEHNSEIPLQLLTGDTGRREDSGADRRERETKEGCGDEKANQRNTRQNNSMTLTKRLIIGEYVRLKNSDFKGYYVRELANRFGYNVNKNGTNTWIQKIVKEFEGELES